ncbi:MAG TPA: phosphoglycerate kinase [Elusimicrobia bacterium]|nr:MAG: phosphoglycerate kinase [Elusimicrobia bacterium GWA2_66_18]OGR69306.1 MAG: phosphoglycerate kinase [Elusimicrobia bacterium GWC2_65_9]HAZ08327.1 phosphoglycerate kinase [Elusimicrobiota bacterium]
MTEKPALKLKRLQDLTFKGKRVLVRVDYNVPMNGSKIEDNARIRETLKTLEALIAGGAKLVLISHLGRPKGKPDPKYTLKPVSEELSKLLKKPVAFACDCVGPEADKAVAAVKSGGVLLLENLRFHAEEEVNDPAFAKALAKHADLFIQEAFGALHRAHASTAGVTRHLPGAIGFLVQKELEFLDRAMGNPVRPFTAIIGGAKVSDKLAVLDKLLERVDVLLIGGGMAYTFLAAQGINIGKSLLEKDQVEAAKAIIEKSYNKKIEILLPADHLAVREIKPDAAVSVTQAMAIPSDLIGVDIGPHTVEFFVEHVAKSKTVFWNGPMGIFEMEAFSKGSFAVAKAMAEATKHGVITIVGGGDSLSVIAKAGLVGTMSHCSTGGGASLELLEGKILPGLAALAS